MIARRRGAGLLFAALLPVAAAAHDQQVSYSRWQVDGSTATVRLRVSQLELARAVPREPAPGAALELRAGGEPCARTNAPARLPAPAGWAQWRWTFRCSDAAPLSIRSRLHEVLSPAHLHWIHVTRADGSQSE